MTYKQLTKLYEYLKRHSNKQFVYATRGYLDGKWCTAVGMNDDINDDAFLKMIFGLLDFYFKNKLTNSEEDLIRKAYYVEMLDDFKEKLIGQVKEKSDA